MKKVLVIAVVFALTFVLGYASPVPAQDNLKKLPCNGTHYTLNIIGVPKGKTAPMTNSERHTIFVGLGSPKNSGASEPVTTRIYLQNGYDFRVCDGNGFDAAHDCVNGSEFKPSGATFQLPCNTALTYTEGFGCPAETDIAQRSYFVFARALGKPGGSASMTTCYLDYSDPINYPEGFPVCSLGVLELSREKGKSLWQDATDELTSLFINGQTISLFATGYEDFFWQYDNYGLKHAQIRLYPVHPVSQ